MVGLLECGGREQSKRQLGGGSEQKTVEEMRRLSEKHGQGENFRS